MTDLFQAYRDARVAQQPEIAAVGGRQNMGPQEQIQQFMQARQALAAAMQALGPGAAQAFNEARGPLTSQLGAAPGQRIPDMTPVGAR